MVEVLEDRCLPATFTWLGGANPIWTNSADWSKVGVSAKGFPDGVGDIAIFNGTAKPPNITVNAGAGFSGTVGELDVQNTYVGTITLNRDLTVLTKLDIAAGTIAGQGSFFLGLLNDPNGLNKVRATNGSISGAVTFNGVAGVASALVVSRDSTLTIAPVNGGVVDFNNRGLDCLKGGNIIVRESGMNATGISIIDASINNEGTYTMIGSVDYGGNGTFNNAGTFSTQAIFNQDNVTAVPIVFNNTGTVNVANLTSLVFQAGGTSSGKYQLMALGQLSFSTLALNTPPTYRWNKGTSFAGGQVNLNDATAVLGEFNLTMSGVTFGIDTGTLTGGILLEAADGSNFVWKDFQVNDVNLSVDKTSSLLMAGMSTITGASIGNTGEISIQALTLLLNSSDIRNDNQFLFLDDSTIIGDETSKFINRGTIVKAGGNGTGKIGVRYLRQDDGTIRIESGTLETANLTEQNKNGLPAALTLLDGGDLQVDGLFTLKSGTVANEGDSLLTGTITADVVNSGGEIDPGDVGQAGLLTIDGDYTQKKQGELNIDLGGPTPGTEFDQLVVTGTVKLGGELNVQELSGFNGSSFEIIDNESSGPVQGTFDGLPEGAKLTVGTTVFQITYKGGDGNDVVLNTVSSQASMTTVSSDSPTSVFGQSVTFTATVAAVPPASGTPTGTVTFFVDGTELGTGQLTNGTASITTSGLSVGSHSIQAVYGGDANFTGSSGIFSQTVNQASTTTSISSDSPTATAGQFVTFTAQVLAVAPGAGTITGIVTFMDGSTVLGTGTVGANGIATFGTSSLTVGQHQITAVYSGDNNFQGSSGSLSQTVIGGSSGPSVASATGLSLSGSDSAGSLLLEDMDPTTVASLSGSSEQAASPASLDSFFAHHYQAPQPTDEDSAWLASVAEHVA